jgi:hypothetical protein
MMGKKATIRPVDEVEMGEVAPSKVLVSSCRR